MKALTDDSTATFLSDALNGLRQPAKELPCKYFYDEVGSQLFDRICELDEYYLTRTERAIMATHVADMAEAVGPHAWLIEYGSGSSSKTRSLLKHLCEPVRYTPIDISADYLHGVADELRREFPELDIHPLAADFTRPLRLPIDPEGMARRVVYFPGSTIGNFPPKEALALLRRIRTVARPGGGLLIGVDLRKDRRILEAAYNDREGVTAAFNLNLLVRMNRELGSDFDVDAFEHRAIYDEIAHRIEMHLISRSDQTVRVGEEIIHFEAGESIRTEYSCKWSVEDFSALARRAGFELRQVWTDAQHWFSVQFYEVPRD